MATKTTVYPPGSEPIESGKIRYTFCIQADSFKEMYKYMRMDLANFLVKNSWERYTKEQLHECPDYYCTLGLSEEQIQKLRKFLETF